MKEALTERLSQMNNVRPFPNDAAFLRDNSEIDREEAAPKRPTTAQLKRTAGVLRRAIAKEEKRQHAAREVDRLSRKLTDTIAMPMDRAQDQYR